MKICLTIKLCARRVAQAVMRVRKCDRSALLVAALVAFCSPSQAETLKVWFKAFIPADHDRPGYIRPRPDHTNEFMIPGPSFPGTNVAIPGVGTSCYNTNNRSFSSDSAAAAKITAALSFTISPSGALSNVSIATPTIGPTERYDCDSGKLLETQTANADSISTTPPRIVGDDVIVEVTAEARNPFAPSIAPTIKFRGTLDINPAKGTAEFNGSTAQFPAYEAYIIVDAGAPLAIFQENPVSNSTAWSLALNRPVKGKVHWNALSGNWRSNDPGSRWTVRVAGEQINVTERNEYGRTFAWSTPLQQDQQGDVQLTRANDARVLSFLGFDAVAVDEILSRAPGPSLLQIRRDGPTVLLTWNGLMVTKDDKGRVVSVRQPREVASKLYRLVRN